MNLGTVGALGTAVGAAAPGIKQGVDALMQPSPAQGISAAQGDQANAQLEGMNAVSDADNASLQAALHPFADPSHPVWPVLSAAAGAPQGAPQQGAIPGMAKGGVVTPVSKQPPVGPLPANFGGAKNYQNGGPVRGNNYGSLTNRPEFTRGPAIPVSANQVHPADLGGEHGATGFQQGGPVDGSGRGGNLGLGQGITSASPEGQMLTMEDGGAVPTSQANFMQPSGALAPPAYSRAAGFATGIQAGESIGHNLQEQWHQNEARRALAAQQGTEAQVAEKAYREANGMAPMEDENGGGPLDRLHSVVNNFMGLLGHHSHDENGTQPDPRLVSQAAPASPAGALPAPAAGPAGGQANPAVPAQTGAPAPAMPGAPPAAAPAPTAGPAGAAGPAGGPAAAASAKAAAVGAPPEQAAATGAAVGATTAALAKPPQRSPDAQTPKGAYSMDPTDFLHMEQAKTRAAQAAALAGLDPTKVYSALSAQQTAHFQGQYLMQVGRAQQAMQLGHYDDMEKYLKNAGYYLPNGQDTEFKKASELTDAQRKALGPDIDSSTRLVTNPFYGMAGHQGEPQYVPLNPISLGSFATAAMDPRAFAQGQQEMLKLGYEHQEKMTTAQGTYLRGLGLSKEGDAAITKSLTGMAESPSRIADNEAQARQRLMMGAYYADKQNHTGGGVKIKPSDLARAQNDGSKAYDDAAQGELSTAPALIPNPDPKLAKSQPMIPNPHGNQPFRDPTKVDPLFQGQSPEEREQGKALAGEIHGANLTADPRTAARVAAQIVVNDRAVARGQYPQHMNPKTNKPELDVVKHTDLGEDGEDHPAVWVWDSQGRTYHRYWLTPNVDTRSGALPAGGESGSAEQPEGIENPVAMQDSKEE